MDFTLATSCSAYETIRFSYQSLVFEIRPDLKALFI